MDKPVIKTKANLMLFNYNSQQWFNTDSIEHISDTGSYVLVTLKSGKECHVHDRERFLKIVAFISKPKAMLVPKGTPVFDGDYGACEIVPVDPVTLRPL